MTLLERAVGQHTNRLQVLTYHRIIDRRGFEQQAKYLAANYRVISMTELLMCCNGDHKLLPGSIMITFDDAYYDFAEIAWPTLKRHKLPVTLFVPTGFPDQSERIFWWDRLQHALNRTSRRERINTPIGWISLTTELQRQQAYERLRRYVKTLTHNEALYWTYHFCDDLDAPPPEHDVLGWDALRQLVSEGVTLGAHTRNHPLMNRISAKEARAEVDGSLKDLEREIGAVMPIFAYPDGRFSDEVVRIVKDAGIVLAFTTVRGTNDLDYADRLRLRRNDIQRLTLPVLRARLLHSSPYLNKVRPVTSS
ncbi:MAG: polysaccharide deacetylase family protein [Candidatus Promineifilaceae bacterium]